MVKEEVMLRGRNGGGSERTCLSRQARAAEEDFVDGQVRRYFLGVISFGVVAVWSAEGMLAAALSLLACALTVYVPPLLVRRRPGPALRHERKTRQRPVRTRTLHTEPLSSRSVVPDDPSLIIELG